jgi:hypothetical protein
MAEPIVVVAGNDIVEGTGGHPRYMRAHARAARCAGFEPHLFSLGRSDGTVGDFGTVHRVRARLALSALQESPPTPHRLHEVGFDFGGLQRMRDHVRRLLGPR